MLINYIIIFIFGLIIGSFINVCIYRLPRNESIINPPSHCASCNTRLKAIDLIPVLSFAFLKAKCRFCGTKISIQYPLIELLTAVIFSVLFYRYEFSIEFIAATYLMSILIVVFFIDAKHMIIPDELVIAGLIGGVLLVIYNFFNSVQIFGENIWWKHLLGALPGSGILLLVAFIGILIYKSEDVMGMGDVKIFAPIGIFLGWKLCIVALMLSIIIAGILSLFLIIIRVKKRKDVIPLGPFIVIGTFLTLLMGNLLL